MLKIENMTKCFKNATKPVLKNINLTIYEGDFCVFVGANGCGKSTLMKAICSDVSINTGKIYLNGKETSEVNEQSISFVDQDVDKNTVSELTVLENLILSSPRMMSFDSIFYKKRKDFFVEKLMALNMNLEDLIDKKMNELSGGQRQAIAVLMATQNPYNLLILDEHTSALDPVSQKKIMIYTSNIIKNKKMTALMVTHNIEDAVHYGNRLIMIKNGEIVGDFSKDHKKLLTVSDVLSFFNAGEMVGHV